MGFLSKLASKVGLSETYDIYSAGLLKTQRDFNDKFNNLFLNFSGFDEEFFEELEEILVMSDITPRITMLLVDELKNKISKKLIKDEEGFKEIFFETFAEFFDNNDNQLNIKDDQLNIILVVGVNGVGKTTSIAKMTKKLKDQNKSVLLAAGDTFRAGATEQLKEWGSRLDVDVISKADGTDPSAVVYDAINAAKARKVDVLICDTAGRLQNKTELMDELAKINQVIKKQSDNANCISLLVLDGTTGQNAISQADAFNNITNIDGLIITKLDGTAKGGILMTLRYEFKIDIKFIGLGEKADDLVEFDLEKYIYSLIPEQTGK